MQLGFSMERIKDSKNEEMIELESLNEHSSAPPE